jgi:uncharacterized protein DUF6093
VAINLEPARRKVEEFMTEEVQVYPPSAVDLLPYNSSTGGLELLAGLDKLYEGKAKLKDITTQSSRGGGSGTTEGGLSLLVVGTKIDFPVGDVPDAGFPKGSLIVCTDALRMPQMIGAQYLIRQETLKTFAVQYSVLADRRQAVDL